MPARTRGVQAVQRRAVSWTALLVVFLVFLSGASASAAERYHLLFSKAAYASPTQGRLNYSSFVGDRQTGGIYSCTGWVTLKPTTGAIDQNDQRCTDAYVPPAGPPGDYTFSRLSALDASPSANTPKMDPAWGFWRIDQNQHRLAFCFRSGSPIVVWTCFDAPLPQH
jgi:hypothetical protein